MIHSPDGAKHAGDIVASIGTAVAVASHWAETLTPIVTFLITLATAGWWILRYIEKFSSRTTGES